MNLKYNKTFYGWGRKKSGFRAIRLAGLNDNSNYILREDGFIRSIGLGNSKSFSLVEDDIGIYYDATKPSRLEYLLNNYDFRSDTKLIEKTKKALHLIRKYKISKYNNGLIITKDYFKNCSREKVLIIDQNKNDLSLKYGLAKEFNINEIIDIAISENPNADVYIKIHPDVINLRKKTEIDLKKLNHRCKIISDDINAISLLENFKKVYTRTSQMGFEGLIMGCECVVFGMPFYAGWGLTDDRVSCSRRNRDLSLNEVFAGSYILYSSYKNPYTQKKTNIIDTIQTILKYKDLEIKSSEKVFLFGFSRWKRRFVFPYLKQFKRKNIHFINPSFSSELNLALRKGINKESKIYIWGSKSFKDVQSFAKKQKISICRVEDGFIRSTAIGSDLTRPYSLIFDDKGIYFDSSKPSKLENILNFSNFDQKLKNEAKLIIKKLVKEGISKYNLNYREKFESTLPSDKKIILVVGQVDNDASIKLGGYSMTNLKLLKRVRYENPEAFIIYKAHPDVTSGNRIGKIGKDQLKSLSNLNLQNVNLSSLILRVDEVHTITSLVGLEALLHKKIVFTYGMPFYAGWGLTHDKQECPRRKRKLSIEELVAGSIILYPLYINPDSYEYCSPEILIDKLVLKLNKIKKYPIYRYKQRVYCLITRTRMMPYHTKQKFGDIFKKIRKLIDCLF